MIQVQGLKKRFGDIQAVGGIDFSVRAGSLFAFLGPNGAGKSTTIDMLCTHLAKDEGTATISGYTLGREDSRIRSLIGVVFQDNVLDSLLTVEENITVRGSLYGLSGGGLSANVEAALKAAEATEFRRQRYGKLSGGQRRRADIARALVNTPKLLFLDEPTTGLDPQTRRTVWETIRRLQQDSGMTVFLTTHYMEEAAAADDVAVIDHGLIVATGTPQQLRSQYSADRLRILPQKGKEQTCLSALSGHEARLTAGAIQIPLAHSTQALDLLPPIRQYIESFEVLAGSMDDVFLAITGRDIREDA